LNREKQLSINALDFLVQGTQIPENILSGKKYFETSSFEQIYFEKTEVLSEETGSRIQENSEYEKMTNDIYDHDLDNKLNTEDNSNQREDEYSDDLRERPESKIEEDKIDPLYDKIDQNGEEEKKAKASNREENDIPHSHEVKNPDKGEKKDLEDTLKQIRQDGEEKEGKRLSGMEVMEKEEESGEEESLLDNKLEKFFPIDEQKNTDKELENTQNEEESESSDRIAGTGKAARQAVNMDKTPAFQDLASKKNGENPDDKQVNKYPVENTGPESKTKAHVLVIDLRENRIKERIEREPVRDPDSMITRENSKDMGLEVKVLSRMEQTDIYDSNTPNRSGFKQTFTTGLKPNILDRFSSMLKNEIVKHTGLIVRENGEGEIRLVLKPESLGNVRIKVLLNNNNIEGRIIVENNSVKEMFEENLKALSDALKDEGFDSTNLDVMVGYDRKKREEPEEFTSNNTIINEFENCSSNLVEGFFMEDNLINLTA
jgi:flagellar protein FlbC